MTAVQYWVIKIGQQEVDSISNQILTYSFETGFNFQGKQGDKVLFLINNKGFQFSFHSEISEQPIVEEIKIDEQRRLFIVKIIFNNIIKFDQPRLLNDFAYTITKVYNYNNPQRHFRSYTRISYRDFTAIEENNIFISRTFFGKVVNSLHRIHRMKFFKRILDEDPKLYTSGKDYYRAFVMLRDYIQDNIIVPAKLLNEAEDWLNEIDSESKSSQLFFVGDYDLKKTDSKRPLLDISKKNKQTKEYISQGQFSFLIRVEKDILEASISENSLNKSFARIPLPIILE